MSAKAWNKEEIFPIIAQIIEKNGDKFMNHKEMVDLLSKDNRVIKILENAFRKMNFKNEQQIASNMIQNFSQNITLGKSEYAKRFIRFHETSGWAYCSSKHAAKIANDDPDISAIEGNYKIIRHISYERDTSLSIKKRKAFIRKNGILFCEICGFRMKDKYVSSDFDIFEVHHVIPLSKLKKSRVTKLNELAILCSNCHRAIHKTKSRSNINHIMSIEEFKNSLLIR